MRKRKKSRFVAAGAVVVTSALFTPAKAVARGEIIQFTHAGSGCPGGSAGWIYDSVNEKLTVNFTEFATSLPPGTAKACNMAFVARMPTPFRIGLRSVEYLGYLDTEPTVQGRLTRRYQYGRRTPQSYIEDFAFGEAGDFYVVDRFTNLDECTDRVTVVTNIRLDLRGQSSGARSSEIVMDTAQYNGRVVFSFEFTPC